MKLEHAEGSERQARRDRAKLQKELAAELRKKDRKKLAELREAIAAARRARRRKMKRAVERCRAERRAIAERAKTKRAELFAALRAELEAERERARSSCNASKAKVREKGALALADLRAVLEAERAYQRELRAAEGRHKEKSKARRTGAERRAESDDAVRANLPAELVAVFNAVRRDIKATPRMSRTEAFLLWAERNPSEVIALQSDAADRDVARLVAEYEAHATKTSKRGRYQRSPEELARELAEVPF